MSDELLEKEKKLESIKIDNDIETQKAEIAQKKAIEARMRREYGTDWKKILGMLRPKASAERLHDLYAISPDLRDLSVPRRAGK